MSWNERGIKLLLETTPVGSKVQWSAIAFPVSDQDLNGWKQGTNVAEWRGAEQKPPCPLTHIYKSGAVWPQPVALNLGKMSARAGQALSSYFHWSLRM